MKACADPESFVRGVPTLAAFLGLMRGEDTNTTKNGPSANLNGVSLAGL